MAITDRIKSSVLNRIAITALDEMNDHGNAGLQFIPVNIRQVISSVQRDYSIKDAGVKRICSLKNHGLTVMLTGHTVMVDTHVAAKWLTMKK